MIPRAVAGVLSLAVVALSFLARPVALDPPDAPLNGDQWFAVQRGYPNGARPPADTLERAMKARRSVPPGPRPSLTLPSDRWVSIGPSPIVVNNTQFYAGRVTAVAAHPTLPGTIYLGADSGGIWRTTNGGTTWTSLTENLPVPAIQSIAIDPVNPQLIYATTIQRTYGTRWLASLDGGSTWSVSPITLADGRTLSPALCSVNVFKACIPPSSGRILIDPARAGSASTSTIYFIGTSHLLRSDDSGRTFRPVLTLPVDLDFAGAAAPTQNPEAPFLRDVAIDPQRSDRLLAAVARPRCLNAGCTRMESAIAAYQSFDGGAHWVTQTLTTLGEYDLTTDLAERYADPGAVYVPRARVAIAPSAPDTLALSVRDLLLNRVRVFLSADAGTSWTESAALNNSLTWPLALAFAPNDPATIYVGSSLVYRSTDAGRTWTTVTGGIHVDNIAIAFTANRGLLLANDGGLYAAPAGSIAMTAVHRALPITEFYSVAAHPANPLLIAGGTQDNGTPIFQGNLGWSMITGGDGGDTVWDPDPDARILYAEVEWAQVNGNQVFQFYRCQSGGCLARRNGIDLTLDGPFIPRMAMDPSAPATIWLTVEKLFRTDNRGENWTAASPSVASDQRCWNDAAAGRTCAPARYFVAAAVAPTASPTVYAGTLNGDVRVTNDRGATWRSVAGTDAGPLPVRAVTDIVIDPLTDQGVFVAYSGFNSGGSGAGHVFHTTNGGTTWTDISGNLPDVPVNTLLIDPDSVSAGSARVIYAGTDIGVFRTTVGSGVWQEFGSGLPPVVVTRLAYNSINRQLLAATYGRGIWAISSRFSR